MGDPALQLGTQDAPLDQTPIAPPAKIRWLRAVERAGLSHGAMLVALYIARLRSYPFAFFSIRALCEVTQRGMCQTRRYLHELIDAGLLDSQASFYESRGLRGHQRASDYAVMLPEGMRGGPSHRCEGIDKRSDSKAAAEPHQPATPIEQPAATPATAAAPKNQNFAQPPVTTGGAGCVTQVGSPSLSTPDGDAATSSPRETTASDGAAATRSSCKSVVAPEHVEGSTALAEPASVQTLPADVDPRDHDGAQGARAILTTRVEPRSLGTLQTASGVGEAHAAGGVLAPGAAALTLQQRLELAQVLRVHGPEVEADVLDVLARDGKGLAPCLVTRALERLAVLDPQDVRASAGGAFRSFVRLAREGKLRAAQGQGAKGGSSLMRWLARELDLVSGLGDGRETRVRELMFQLGQRVTSAANAAERAAGVAALHALGLNLHEIDRAIHVAKQQAVRVALGELPATAPPAAPDLDVRDLDRRLPPSHEVDVRDDQAGAGFLRHLQRRGLLSPPREDPPSEP